MRKPRPIRLVLLSLVLIVLAAAFMADTCAAGEDPITHGSCVQVGDRELCQGGNNGGGGGGGGGPTATPTPPQPTATPTPAAWGGFSTGGWNGTGQIAPGYTYGTIDATVGSMSALCPWNYPNGEVIANEESPVEVPALRALWGSSHAAGAFFFLTSLYHVTNQCATHAPAGLTATQWGTIQADYFVQMVHDACQQNPCEPIDYYFGDLERAFDSCNGCDPTYDYAGWKYGSDNAIVVSAFENTLYHYCAMNSLYGADCPYPNGVFTYREGVYTNTGEVLAIPGFGSNMPDISTDTIWEAGYVYNGTPQSIVNQDENFFTNQGYHIYSWQYATDACWVTYSNARAMAQAASPPIPRFDRWTPAGGGVGSVC